MSTLRVNTIADQAGTGQPTIDGLAKAWVNFNGTGTVAIRASFNVSSITDNGTGDYTVNFTNAMPDANYSANTTAGDFNNSSGSRSVMATAAYFQIGSVDVYLVLSASYAYYDGNMVSVTIFR